MLVLHAAEPAAAAAAKPAPTVHLQKRQHSEGGGGDERSVRPRTDAWQTPEQIESNGLFEEYYKEHNVCPPEVRW